MLSLNRTLSASMAMGLLFTLVCQSALIQEEVSIASIRKDLNGAQINRTRVVLDPRNNRMALDRFGKSLDQSERECLLKQRRLVEDATERSPSSEKAKLADYRLSYEIISSKSSDFDSARLLNDTSITGPFKGLVSYKIGGKRTQVLHVPVIVYSDGTCVPLKAEKIRAELKTARRFR